MEGLSVSAIARFERLSWNTVARWLARAAQAARAFNANRLRGFELLELQVDEIRTFALGKDRPTWIYTTMEVSSRLWPTLNVGSRGYRTTLSVMRDVAARALPGAAPLIATDGYRYYKPAVRQVFGSFCHFGQVIKQRRKDRVVKVERKAIIGTRREIAAALERSEDSTTLNTSFIERLNLVIRQGSAYLTRRAATHARSVQRLTEHLELFRCFYNFIRPHGALRFGKEVRTPAQQAGLVGRRLTWREILSTPLPAFLCARGAPVVSLAARRSIRVRIAA
jgi:IS1 family transposase